MLHQPIDTSAKWCILRCSAARTLALAASLRDAGYEAWTPVDHVTRRRSRSKAIVAFDAPMLPTYVFARADANLMVHVSKQLGSPHPAFSVYQHAGRAPLLADAGLNHLRALEERSADRARKRDGKAKAPRFAPGAVVRIADGQTAWRGMSGIVESEDGRDALVNFGGSYAVRISRWQLVGGAEMVPAAPASACVLDHAIAA